MAKSKRAKRPSPSNSRKSTKSRTSPDSRNPAERRARRRTAVASPAVRVENPVPPAPQPDGDTHPVPESNRPLGPPVVGIGASAGGLDAFEKLFSAMPPDTGVAFVLIPHLDPNHQSFMVELLARHTVMPVTEAREGMPAAANRVYVIPPNHYMTIAGGVLRLTGPVERATSQTSIDIFLRSLADDQQERAICIILSGTGSHGSLGLKAVKAAGGMAMVQDPATAAYDRMPLSAVGTGLADYVLPVERMPAALVGYVRHSYMRNEPHGQEADDPQDDLGGVVALLQARTKSDFHGYRKKTLLRRIERRMALSHHVDRLADYLAHLRQHPEELANLARDLVIGVTSFFRDPEAFQALEESVVTPLVRDAPPDQPIRVWAPACATGEEAYSIAMSFLDQLAATGKSAPLQIFATDVNEAALETARHGVYPGIAADVTPDRLKRFFTRVNESSYQVTKPLRESVVFAVQNLITDAPFSKLHLVSCRNLLIYLEPDVQKKVVALLHFALRENGHLFLGPAETIGRQIDLFEPLSKKWRVYRRIGARGAQQVQFPIASRKAAYALGPRWPSTRDDGPSVDFGAVTQRLLLDAFGPAAVLVNRKHEVLYFFGPTTRYLGQPPGEPTQDIIALAREGLRTKLRVAVHQAIREEQPAATGVVRIQRNGGPAHVSAQVSPVTGVPGAEGFLLVTFQDQHQAPPDRDLPAPTDDLLMRQLEHELKATRDDLQSTLEEMESSNEELKTSNEEVMSMNEELQSANEELETSKEELQSLNEELTTVNHQLQEKVEAVEEANNDMANLLNCTDIATVFLDTRFRVKRFTPSSTRLFNLIATDVGRPIRDITQRFADDDLLSDVEQVLQDLRPREREIETHEHQWCIRRIVPYRTLDDRIDGAAVTFSDVTRLKHAEEGQRTLSMELEKRVAKRTAELETANQRLQAEVVERQRAEEGLTQQARQQAAVSALGSRALRDRHLRTLLDDACRTTVETLGCEFCKVLELRPGAGELVLRAGVGWSEGLVSSAVVPTGADSQAGYTLLVGQPVVVEDLATETRFKGPTLLREHGIVSGMSCVIVNAGRGGEPWGVFGAHTRRRRSFTPDDVHFLQTVANLLGGAVERDAAEKALEESRERLQAIVTTAADSIITIDRQGIIESVNLAGERAFGYAASEMIGRNVSMLMPDPYAREHDGYLARFLETGVKKVIGIGREVVGRRKDGSLFPVDISLSELREHRLFTGILRDVTRRKDLEREVLEIAALEEGRIGEELHDNAGQELTGLGLMASALAKRLAGRDESELARKVVVGLERTQEQIRSLAHGLVPIQVEPDALSQTLENLVQRIRDPSSIECSFEDPDAVLVTDSIVATHLCKIAQEALHNAVRHAHARHVHVALRGSDGSLTLTVTDDGVGMETALDRPGGLGLRLMRNRAGLIGARLSIESQPGQGTRIVCTMPWGATHG